MTREEKNQSIEALQGELAANSTIYLADISALDAEGSSRLRRLCHKNNVSLRVVKNTLLKRAMDGVEDKDFSEMYASLKGNTSVLYSETGSAPAKLIKEFRKKYERPILKAAFIEEAVYIGDEQLDALSELKSKDELIGEIVGLLQSPAKNLISALQSGKSTLAGVVKALGERSE